MIWLEHFHWGWGKPLQINQIGHNIIHLILFSNVFYNVYVDKCSNFVRSRVTWMHKTTFCWWHFAYLLVKQKLLRTLSKLSFAQVLPAPAIHNDTQHASCDISSLTFIFLQLIHHWDSYIEKIKNIYHRAHLSWSLNPIYWIVQRVCQQIPSAFWPYILEL